MKRGRKLKDSKVGGESERECKSKTEGPPWNGLEHVQLYSKSAKYILLCLWMENGIEQWAGIYSAFEKQLLSACTLNTPSIAFRPKKLFLALVAPWQPVEDNTPYLAVTSSSIPWAFCVLSKVMHVSRRKENTRYIFYELYINRVYILWPDFAIKARRFVGLEQISQRDEWDISDLILESGYTIA